MGSTRITRPPRFCIRLMMGTRLMLVETGFLAHSTMEALFSWSRGSWDTRSPTSRFWEAWPVPPHSDPR